VVNMNLMSAVFSRFYTSWHECAKRTAEEKNIFLIRHGGIRILCVVDSDSPMFDLANNEIKKKGLRAIGVNMTGRPEGLC